VSYRNGMAFRRFLYNSFFHNRGTHFRLTAKRLGVLLTVLAIYLPAQLIIWAGLYLDELFFPRYHEIKIKEPVFIIGNPRSGTTFLQRLIARDTSQFLSMRTWEIFGSPSITTRRVIRRAVKIGRAVGVPITRRIRRMERLWKADDKIHRFKLRSPEEDEYLFIHNFSTLKIWSFAAMVDEAEPYIYYDEKIPGEDNIRIMDFYESCLQRHYFYHGQYQKHYLSKNPNFSPAIKSLLNKFPDAKFIYLIRNPLEAVPSHISLKEREWQMLGSPMYEYACKDFILESSEHWYNYSLEVLGNLPEEQVVIVKFEDLITDADRTVRRIYDRFGLSISLAFQEILEHETIRARNYQSKHKYSLAEMGIDLEQMKDRFGKVMQKFGYRI